MSKRIILCSLAAMTSVIEFLHATTLCIFLAVEVSRSESKYLLRMCSQPEIN